MNVQFGTGTQSGTITGITAGTSDPAGTVPATQATGSNATVNFSSDFGLGAQALSLNLGQFGTTSGMTQFAGSDYQVSSNTQNGSPTGNFSSVSIQPSGNVVISYDNGTLATVAKVPLTNFNDPNALQQQDGQAFTATLDSGVPETFASGEGGTGKLIGGAEEASNVDIAAQFTQMIVAQRAYTANTKVISTANQLLQDTLNMVQG
jgi:flagellar hook protein FlgE